MRSRVLGAILLLLCSTLVGLAIAEVAVRVAWGVPMPEKLPLVRGHYDAHGNEVMAAAVAGDHIRCPF